MLALGICGIVGATVAAGRPDSGGVDGALRLLAIVLAAALPILLTIILQPYIYNGIRHLLFIVPPFAVLGGLAGGMDRPPSCISTAAPRSAAGAIALAAGIVSPVADMVRLHPYEYTDFNHFVGGVKGRAPAVHA